MSQIDHEPKTIEHNPHEKRQPKWLWKAALVVIAGFWLLQFRRGFDWDQIALGALSGLLLGLWAMEVTGGEVPESWRRKPPRQG